MKELGGNLLKKLFVIALVAAPLIAVAGEAEKQVANELLDVMQFEKVMNDTITASMQMVKQMSPEMDSQESMLREFFNKYMSIESLRDDMCNMYAEIFSEKELKDMVAFYETETGQKILEKTPEIMQHSMQNAQTRIMQNFGELQILSDQDPIAEEN